jgi:hypothetical protein
MTARVRRTVSIPLFLVLITSRFDCRHATEPPQTRVGSDTTSHNFFWRLDTLGVGSANSLRDVAVINDTLAYAVGEVYLYDSLGNVDPNAYNMIKWDGTRWTPMRLEFHTICGQAGTTPYPASAVFALSPIDVWIAAAGQIARWDGSSQTETMCLPFSFSIYKVWGSNPKSVYAVGYAGNIAYYNGNTWQMLSSGTDVDLLDVNGTPDGSTVWACGWGNTTPMVLLRIKGTQVETAYQSSDYSQERADSLSGPLVSVVSPSGVYLFVCSGYGLYQCPPITQGEGKRMSFVPDYFPGFPSRVRGTRDNDLFITGTYNFVAHYNGRSWRHYVELMSQEGRFTSVDVKGNLAVAVGYLYNDPLIVQAEMAIGRR